ncbi:SLC13 family permease [Rhodobaculum claviforme]|uniref:SLC13 family permease n=1 Tax=Rhodobaculum claviforme TaxID=1549854 RepID=UPI001913C072|nr:SLC13 family permease [Rhodobaculum claviforme]
MSLASVATAAGLTVDQFLTLMVIVATMIAFVWNRIRHDIVAFAALLACVLLGLTPADTAFKGFGNHAVVMVVFVLILSHGFQRSGAIDAVSHWLVAERGSAFRGVVLFTLFGAVLAAFITNIGALALLMPLGLQFAQRNGLPPALVLVPLSYGTIFGGMVTLIGSPANLLVSGFREDELQAGFAMFDFLAVGAAVGAVALLLVLALSRLLIPRRAVRNAQAFEISAYQTEARVGPSSSAAGATVRQIEAIVGESGARVIGLAHGNARTVPPHRQIVRVGDILVIEANPTTLPGVLARLDLTLEEEVAPEPADPAPGPGADTVLTELAVLPGARLAGRSAREIRLRSRFGINLLAVSRAGRRDPRRLRDMTITEGDVLLVQGGDEDIADFARDYGCAPLAARPLRLPKVRRMVLALAILVGAVAVSATGVLPTAVAYGCAALLAILTGVTPARSVPGAVDWTVVVLLGALIPVANAVEATGLAEVAAKGALSLGGAAPEGAFLIGVVIVASMVLTNVLNNAAAVAIMAPVAFSIARSLEIGPDPLLMAVAIGAQAGFLTPIGHQSNTLILSSSGLRFWDFWQLGLPLQAAVLAVAVPAILFVWPISQAG